MDELKINRKENNGSVASLRRKPVEEQGVGGKPQLRTYIWNAAWEEKTSPYFTVITAVYNRREELPRAMASVERQTFCDLEYIIVNDGSQVELDDIVEAFMEKAAFPVLYIKKENGGLHTALNIGIKHGRGVMWCQLDSDDELVPDALQVAYDIWKSIPADRVSEYREICAQCQDQDGKRVGEPFAEAINDMPRDEAYRLARKTHGEHFGIGLLQVMKENPWPEPKGVTYVEEGYLWKRLAKEYRSYYTNSMLRIYHIEGEDSMTNSKKRNMQFIRNGYWNYCVSLNDEKDGYGRPSAKERIFGIIVYDTFSRILSLRCDAMAGTMKLKGFRNRALAALLRAPSAVYARKYMKRLED